MHEQPPTPEPNFFIGMAWAFVLSWAFWLLLAWLLDW